MLAIQYFDWQALATSQAVPNDLSSAEQHRWAVSVVF
jgi:hypothetical protein